MAKRSTTKQPQDVRGTFEAIFGGKRKPKLPDPFEPLRDRKFKKHVDFLKRAEEGTFINDLLAGFGIAKDFMIVYNLADELNKLKTGESMEWEYWPSTFDEDGAIVPDPEGPYTLKVERTNKATGAGKFGPLSNSNYGWCWDSFRKQWVWQLKS